MARFLAEPEVEREVRRDPAAAAARHGVSVEIARRLAALDPRRVEAFRASAAHKARVRGGAKSSRAD
jgi:hypothetical protein